MSCNLFLELKTHYIRPSTLTSGVVNNINKPLIVLWGARTHQKHETLAPVEGPAVVRINLFVRSIATISDIKMVSPVSCAAQGK